MTLKMLAVAAPSSVMGEPKEIKTMNFGLQLTVLG